MKSSTAGRQTDCDGPFQGQAPFGEPQGILGFPKIVVYGMLLVMLVMFSHHLLTTTDDVTASSRFKNGVDLQALPIEIRGKINFFSLSLCFALFGTNCNWTHLYFPILRLFPATAA